MARGPSRFHIANTPGWSEMTREEKNAFNGKTWREKNPEKAQAGSEHSTLMQRFKRHGLTLDQYHSMAEKQDFLCALCKEESVPRTRKDKREHKDGFVIDHNHATGKVRGLLCYNCNVGIGMLKDSPNLLIAASIYLGS